LLNDLIHHPSSIVLRRSPAHLRFASCRDSDYCISFALSLSPQHNPHDFGRAVDP
jgi:hypothetical protein